MLLDGLILLTHNSPFPSPQIPRSENWWNTLWTNTGTNPAMWEGFCLCKSTCHHFRLEAQIRDSQETPEGWRNSINTQVWYALCLARGWCGFLWQPWCAKEGEESVFSLILAYLCKWPERSEGRWCQCPVTRTHCIAKANNSEETTKRELLGINL